MAQLWLIKQQVKANKWRFTTDDDNVLITSFSHVFKDEIKQKKAYHFICKLDKALSRQDAFTEYVNSIKNLEDWAERNKIEYSNLHEVAKLFLQKQLDHHEFTKHYTPLGEVYREYAKNPIGQPIGMMDRGHRIVDVVTDMSHLANEALANLLLSVNNFLQ